MRKLLRIFEVTTLFMSILSCFVFAQQEQITITTYYPSPFGSYRDLETQRLAVAYPAGAAVFTNNFINVRTGYADTTISIGGDGAGNDAEIRLTAPAARNTVTFRNVGTGRLARINAAICLRRRFTIASGTVECPPNYAIVMASVRPENDAGDPVTSGRYLCCAFCRDELPSIFAPDGLCD